MTQSMSDNAREKGNQRDQGTCNNPSARTHGKILVIYFHNLGFPLRKTNEQMLRCFADYSDHLVYFLNLARPVPSYLLEVEFDLIVFHDLLLCKRSLPRRFAFIRAQARPLSRLRGYRIATVQDEFTQTSLLNDFLLEAGVQHVFSVAPPSEWSKIYPRLDPARVKFDFMLTGYLDDAMLARVDALAATIPTRDIDIGYRAAYARFALGRMGYLKVQIADLFRSAAIGSGLNVDVSNDPKDTILGEAWYRFLLRCKYTLGVESGASVLDHDGSVDEAVATYLAAHPGASFDQVAQACFPGRDGELKLQVVGPRHLEACATRTCQILTEGDYNGILKPMVHYIPVKPDFSNISEVLEIVRNDSLRETIVERAYRDVVQSRAYSFESYVQTIFERSLGSRYEWSPVSAKDREAYDRLAQREALTWQYIRLRSFIMGGILKRLPRGIFTTVERFMKRAPGAPAPVAAAISSHPLELHGKSTSSDNPLS